MTRRSSVPAPHQRTLDIAQRLNNIADTIAIVKAHIARELRAIDGYPSPSEDGGRSSGPSSIVEAMILQRDELATVNWQIDENLRTIDSIITHTVNECTKALGTRLPHPALAVLNLKPCNQGHGLGLDGLIDWQNPLCPDYVGDEQVLPGMCDRCLGRCNQWRRERDMEAITRDSDARYRHSTRGVNGRWSA